MKTSARKLAATRNLWNVYCSIFARREIDLPTRCAKWSAEKRRTLEKYSAAKDFDALCSDGCRALPLAILIAIIQPLRSFEKKWSKITGTPRQRERKIRVMEKAATALEEVLGTLADVIIEDECHRSTHPADLKNLRRDLMKPPDSVPTRATTTDVSDPAVTIRDLRMYASILRIFELSQEGTGATSADMFVKYLFSAYVYRATGQFHDAEVSALIGAALGIIYDETVHRVWRSRNYKRIDKTLSSIAEILTDLGKVSAT